MPNGRTLAALGCAGLLSACMPGGGRRGVLVSSEHSDYSPVVILYARVRVSDSVRVEVTRARILAPGEVFEGMGPIAGKLSIEAPLVTDPLTGSSASPGNGTRNGVQKPWVERAASEARPLVDSLVMGVPQTVAALQFTLPRVDGIDPRRSWLVFRITGASVSAPVHMADGSVLPASTDSTGIRVFACAVTNLNGGTDKARRQRMQRSYSEGC